MANGWEQITMKTNAEHISWSRAGYVETFSLKSTGETHFEFYLQFTLGAVHILHILMQEHILYMELGKQSLTNTTE